MRFIVEISRENSKTGTTISDLRTILEQSQEEAQQVIRGRHQYMGTKCNLVPLMEEKASVLLHTSGS
jgi:hypothetical protein